MSERQLAEVITLRDPIQLVEGNKSGQFVVSQIKVYEPTMADLVHVPLKPKELGEFMDTWVSMTGEREEVLRRLKPYDSGALADAVDVLTSPFVQARLERQMERELKRAQEAAALKTAAERTSTPSSGESSPS